MPMNAFAVAAVSGSRRRGVGSAQIRQKFEKD